jgi:hypothetical protein
MRDKDGEAAISVMGAPHIDDCPPEPVADITELMQGDMRSKNWRVPWSRPSSHLEKLAGDAITERPGGFDPLRP